MHQLEPAHMTKAMRPDSKIYVAGHRGLVGSALMRRLTSPPLPPGKGNSSPPLPPGKGNSSPPLPLGEGNFAPPLPLGEGRGEGNSWSEHQGPYTNIITRTHAELDLTDQAAVRAFFEQEKPEYVFLAAAKVGGILANSTYPAEFIQQNLAIQTNVIHEAWRTGVKRLLFLGSSCIYPRDCPQPIKEEYLLTGPLEPSNRPYAIAKIAGIEMCWSYNRQYGTQYLAVMPTNLYGPGDNYDLNNSHVIPALIRKFHEAKVRGDKEVVVWGTGTPRREFLYSDDMADACVFLMNLADERFSKLLGSGKEGGDVKSPPLINIGVGSDLTIQELAMTIKEVVGFSGEIRCDTSKPDGTPRKLMDIARLANIGWKAGVPLTEGISMSYAAYTATLS